MEAPCTFWCPVEYGCKSAERVLPMRGISNVFADFIRSCCTACRTSGQMFEPLASTQPSMSQGEWSILLNEGDTFGEEALISCRAGSRRTVTAIAEGTSLKPGGGAAFLYITRKAYEEITDPPSNGSNDANKSTPASLLGLQQL